MPENKEHSLLSPSASYRWINCSGSFLLPQFNEERDTTAADEGTLVHKLSELKLNENIWIDDKEEFNEVRSNPLYKQEMEEYSNAYVDFIESKDYQERLIEEVVDLSFIYPDFFGTSDCILMDNSGIEVIDLKYGKFPVQSKNNTQLMIYALGASKIYMNKFPEVKKKENFSIKLTIFQPRINNVSTWETNWKDLVLWYQNTLIPALGKIEYGAIEENTGDWCRFCPAQIFCREYSSNLIIDTDSDLKALSDSEIEDYYSKLTEIEKFLKKTKNYITSEIKKGKHFNNYKLVEGVNKRSWSNEELLINAMKLNEDYERVVQLPSVRQLEKELTKEEMEKYNGFIEIKKGNPQLVTRDNKKEELKFED